MTRNNTTKTLFVSVRAATVLFVFCIESFNSAALACLRNNVTPVSLEEAQLDGATKCAQNEQLALKLGTLLKLDAAKTADEGIGRNDYRILVNYWPGTCTRLDTVYFGSNSCARSIFRNDLRKNHSETVAFISVYRSDMPPPSSYSESDWCFQAVKTVADTFVEKYNERILSNPNGRKANLCNE